MCAVSFVGDHYRNMWQPQHWYQPHINPPVTTTITIPPQISRAEFDELKRQVSEMKELLRRAKIYDEQTGQPDCEMDEKMDVLRKVAKLVGISLDDVIGNSSLTDTPDRQASV